MQEWREIYSKRYHEASGKWTFRGFEWHVFTFGFAKAIEGEKALVQYRSQPMCSFYVVRENRERMVYQYAPIEEWPEFGDVDAYVFPTDLSWTMVFTHHHPTIGPFFSRKEWNE